jgi:YD repeat-containing protein
MKRIFLYLLAITLLPQVISAAVLVGKTEGAFSVSPTGAATYTIPIKVQNGLSDFSPSISLTYSSQAGNGIAGMGFSISGLSAISIVPRSVYFDYDAEEIKESEDNAFTLDGQRLLHANRGEVDNGQTGAVYRTENEQYNIISITASQNGTPATFQVKATNGTTYKYGSSTGRRTQSNGKAYQWALDYAEDALGNYIQYTYSQEGVLYPTSITYGRNIHGTAGVDCTILFNYESRPDSIPVYMFGEQRFLKKRLKSIVCKYDGNVYRTYTLNYTEDVFSHLTSVSETGTGSASVPPTTFEWEVPSEFRLDCSSRDIEGSDDDEDDDEDDKDDKVDYYYFSSDLDGDGFSEMIKVKKETFSNYNTRTDFYINKWVPGSESYAWVNSYSIQSGFFDTLYGSYAIRAYKQKGNSLVLPCCTVYPTDRLRSQMSFIFPEKNWVFDIPLKGRPTEVEEIPAYIYMDSDGDGVDNIFVIEKEKKNNKYPAYLATIDFLGNEITTTPYNLSLNGAPDKIRCADFNADGMPDLLITTSNTLYIYFNKAGTFSDENRFWCYHPSFKGFDVIEIGDFNGDGLMDLIVDVEEVHWMVALNSGNVNGDLFHWEGISGLFVNGAYESTGRRDDLFCIVQDIDGDGKSDAIVGCPHKEEGGSAHVLKFNGYSFDIVSGYGMRDSNEFPNRSHIIQGDFEGKGRAQILYKGKGLGQETTGWNLLQNTTMIPSTQKIISVTDGLGVKDSISYGLLTDKDVYQVNDNSTLPQSVIYLAGGLPVVKTWTEVIPTESRTTDYSYANGLLHLQGKGFLGFKDIKTISSTGIVTETHNELNNTFRVLLPKRVIQSNTCGDILSQKTFTTTLDYEDLRSYKTKETYSTSNKPFDDFTESEESKEFINGFPRFQGSYNDLTQTETFTSFWESPREGVYIKGLPEEIQIGKGNLTFDTEDDLILDNILYERDPATGLVLKETRKRIYYEEDIISTDGYSYNEYGQVTQHYTVAYNSTDTLVTRYEYNAKGQLSKEYDPKGLYRRYTYNSNGTLASVRDFDGITIRYTYDGLLRETSKSRASISTYKVQRARSNYGGSVYSITESVTGKTPVTTYYDAWGRKIAESAPLANGSAMYTDYRYNSNGQLDFVSFPHRKNETTSEGTTYTYDALFRKISEVDSNGKTNTWSYSPKQVTSCIDGGTTTTKYFTEDKISEVEDAAGSVKYDYNADLNVSSIISDAGTAQYQYDAVGRLVQTSDMNGVVKQYEYDQNGYLWKTTIDGSTVETNYDKYGLLRSKTWSEPGESPHTRTFTYDRYFRLTSDRGEGYSRYYSYDTYGRTWGGVQVLPMVIQKSSV